MEKLRKNFMEYYLGLLTWEDMRNKINKESREEFLNWAHDNSLFPSAYQLLSKIEPNEDKYRGDKHQEEFEKYISGRETMLENLDDISRISEEHGIQVIYLKGLSYEEYYINHQYRKTKDIDIVIENKDYLWPFVSNAFCKNYEHIFMPTLRASSVLSNNLSECIVGLVKIENQNLPFSGIEFDLAGFTITDCTYIPAEELFQDTKNYILENGTKVKVPSIRNQLLILLAELVTRPEIVTRDALDAVLLMNQIDDNGLVELQEKVLRYSLKNELIRLIRSIYALGIDLSCNLPTPTINFIKHYKSAQYHSKEKDRVYTGHIIPFIFNRLPKNKAFKEVTHFRRRERLNNLIEKHKSDNRYVDRLNKVGERFENPKEQFQEGHYVFLIYLGDHIKSKWKWIELNGYQYISTPVGIYWVSKEALDPEEVYDQAYEVSLTLV